MMRANLTSIMALARPMRMVPVEEFDLIVNELEELRRRDRARVDLAYEERAAVVAWLREHANAEHPIERGVPSLSPAGRGLLLLHADCIERGEHRREEGA